MQAARNWRDEFEEYDDQGYRVVDVWYRGDRPRVYLFLAATGRECVAISADRLVPKPRPKTLRPYRRGEVKCGDVFRGKISDRDAMVTILDDSAVILCGSTHSYRELLDMRTRPDGSPAGVEE